MVLSSTRQCGLCCEVLYQQTKELDLPNNSATYLRTSNMRSGMLLILKVCPVAPLLNDSPCSFEICLDM